MTLSGKRYVCSAGETFDSIALTYYGDEKFAAELLCANPALCTVPVFTGGELVQLPVIDIPEDDGGNSYAPASAPWKE